MNTTEAKFVVVVIVDPTANASAMPLVVKINEIHLFYTLKIDKSKDKFDIESNAEGDPV